MGSAAAVPPHVRRARDRLLSKGQGKTRGRETSWRNVKDLGLRQDPSPPAHLNPIQRVTGGPETEAVSARSGLSGICLVSYASRWLSPRPPWDERTAERNRPGGLQRVSPGRALTPIRDHWLVPGAKGCAPSSLCLSSPWPQFPHLLSAPGQVSALAMVWVLRGAGKPLGEHPCSGRAEEKGLSLSLYLRTGGPGPVPCGTEGGDARGVPAPSP